MGWWEQEDSDWDVCVAAQVGGAVGVGLGGFATQFRSANIPVRPVFLLLAAGFGLGGSIGGGASLPWSAVVGSLRNPHGQLDADDYIWNRVTGTFSCQDLNNAAGGIVQIGASAMVAGVSFANLSAERGWSDPRPGPLLFEQRVQIPRSLRALGRALADTPQISGGFGAGGFVFRGIFHYIGS
jgi:hypothetical protein